MYLYYLIALIMVVFDQYTKWLVVHNMKLGEQIPIVENLLYITSHRNSGAAWGILEGQMMFFYVITAVVLVGIIYYMEKYARGDKLLATSLSLILGGAIGNFIDRLLHKEVVDFLDVMIFGYDYPVFNVADSSLVVGVILVLIATIMEERKKGKTKK